MFHLRDLPLVKLYYRMAHFKLWRELARHILDEDDEGLLGREDDIVQCVEYEVQDEDEHPESYLVHWIARCPDHTKGRIMFQTLQRACSVRSHYHWHEIMRISGRPMMVGAVMSQNFKLLEHAMAHVDEIELERILEDVYLPEVQKWYDENFVVT